MHEHYPISVRIIHDGYGIHKIIYDSKELEDYVNINCGIFNFYISISSIDLWMNKIYIDIDHPQGVIGAFPETCRLYIWLINHGFNVIPVASGSKGFNLYILLNPTKYENEQEAKRLLKNASFWILSEVFGWEDDTDKSGNKTGRRTILTECIDPQVIGDVRRISRPPNTLRPPDNKTWCVYLPQNFHKLTTTEIVELMKKPQHYDYKLKGEYPTLYDFPEAPENIRVVNPHRKVSEKNSIPDVGIGTSISLRGDSLLKNMLRPCLFRHMCMPNPIQEVRFASTLDLLQFWTEGEIQEMYSKLGWIDYDTTITAYHIADAKASGYNSYSCTRLRELGIPDVCCIG